MSEINYFTEQIPDRAIFIPATFRASKTQSKSLSWGKDQAPKQCLCHQKTHQRYHKATLMVWKAFRTVFQSRFDPDLTPHIVKFYFVRDSRRKFDYTSAIDTCQDIMTEAGWWDDDNCDICIPQPIGYHVDKEKAGVWIWV